MMASPSTTNDQNNTYNMCMSRHDKMYTGINQGLEPNRREPVRDRTFKILRTGTDTPLFS